MPFNDDISVLTDDRGFSFSRSKSRRNGGGGGGGGGGGSSSQSSTGGSMTTRRRSLNPFRARRQRAQGPDDVSVSDSLCSGVLRDSSGALGGLSRRSLGSTLGSARGGTVDSGGSNADAVVGRTSGLPPVAPTTSTSTTTTTAAAPATAPLTPGGVADFHANFNKKEFKDGESSLSGSDQFLPNSTISAGLGDADAGSIKEAMSLAESTDRTLAEDAARREARKERVKEKLERYKREQRQLRQSCVALEEQLAQTTTKLKEVDSRASFKIDSLESELRETRTGMERVAKQSTKEVTDQSDVIKTLGRKLIRQAHVIKRQKSAVEQYKVQLEAMDEEMAMQDERDSKREEEYEELRDKYENLKEQKVQMQRLLQENIEEMMDLKSETEADAKRVMELEFNLQQKEATLDRVAREASEKARKIAELEDELEEKNREVESTGENLKESLISVEDLRAELESANKQIEELRCQYSSWKTTDSSVGAAAAAGGGGEEKDATAAGGGGSESSNPAGPPLRRPASFMSWKLGGGDEDLDLDAMDMETFDQTLRAKDARIQKLDETVQEHEETIKSLRSDVVKMSSTYKQDSYLKRKEIAQLKQRNAEYALKLRALEKAFKSVNAAGAGATASGPFHSHTMHGGGGSSPTGGGILRGSLGPHGALGAASRHGKSMHSVESSVASKEDKAAAVKARMGGLAPYEFPSADQLRVKDSRVVMEANFFDGSDQASEDGRKGEPAEEG